MKKTLITILLAVSLAFSGCLSAQQVQTAEKDLAKVLQAVDNAIAVADTPGLLSQAESGLSELATIAPQTGPIHQAIVDAQAALAAVQKNQGTVATVQVALQVLINLLENQGSIPLGAVRHHGAVAPGTVRKFGPCAPTPIVEPSPK